MAGVAVTPERSWHTGSGQALLLRDWGGEFAVFNPLSGHTHILDFIAASLLQALANGARSEVQLGLSLADALELPHDTPLQAQLMALLEQLDDQGLIAPVSPC